MPWRDEMTPRDFCYWLQGYCEVRVGQKDVTSCMAPETASWNVIVDHLSLVKSNLTLSNEPLDKFGEFIVYLYGFVMFTDTDLPTESQWANIVERLQDLFVKKTGSAVKHDAVEDDDMKSLADILKEAIDKGKETDSWPWTNIKPLPTDSTFERNPTYCVNTNERDSEFYDSQFFSNHPAKSDD